MHGGVLHASSHKLAANMFHGILLASSLLALVSQAFAQAPIYGQCGGVGW